MQRQLKQKGTNYSALLEKVRREQALQHLKSSTLEIKEIGYLVGFNDTSAFIRNFRQWEGITLGEYRKTNKAQK